VQLLDERLALTRQLEHVDAAIGGVVPAHEELLLLQPVDDVSDRGQGHAERLGHVAHVTPRVVAHVEEGLRLRVREVELGGSLPHELPEGRAAQRIQQVEESLGLVSARARSRRSHDT
jgi:hypothetical protein